VNVLREQKNYEWNALQHEWYKCKSLTDLMNQMPCKLNGKWLFLSEEFVFWMYRTWIWGSKDEMFWNMTCQLSPVFWLVEKCACYDITDILIGWKVCMLWHHWYFDWMKSVLVMMTSLMFWLDEKCATN